MHSSGSISSCRHSSERPSTWIARRWLAHRSRDRANQNAESPVRTRPLSGISVGSTTSKVEIRSLATSSSRSSSSAYSSRTFPLATCAGASGMNRLLSPRERAQPLEHGVDVTGVDARVEDRVDVDARGDLGVGAHERWEVEPLVPRAHRIALDEAVRVVAGEPRLDEREQDALAEVQPVT